MSATCICPNAGVIHTECREHSWKHILAERDALRELSAKLLDALIWCSGSADFQRGGVARVGWLRVQPLIPEALKALGLRVEPDPNGREP